MSLEIKISTDCDWTGVLMEMQLEIALHNTNYSNSLTDMKPRRLLSVKITRVKVKLKVMQNTSGRHQIDRQCSGIVLHNLPLT